ncbi:MAG TPA: cytochrome P450 [Enhygromyxa sp.]|nr:cytochrome P450 [Enhygromyxa sp.]
MPKVKGAPVLGALPELLRDQFTALRRWQREYGGVFELDVGAANFVVAADANAAAEMLIERHRSFARGGPLYDPLLGLFGRSLLTSEGDIWRTRRRAVQPRFRQQAVGAMSEQVERTLAEVFEPLRAGPCNIENLTGRIAMSVALRVMFGEGLDDQRFDTLADAVDHAVRRVVYGWATNRLPRWLPLPGRAKYRRALATIDEVIGSMIEARRSTGEFGNDFLGMLLHMTDDGAIETADIRNEAVTLIIAGYETTATAMSWALYELARNPELLARVQAEADALGGGEPDLGKLGFTVQCFKEAMRMYPSGIWLPRHTAEDSELAGYPIKAGTAVLCSPYLVHHDPHAWDEPERFDPERFAEGSNQPRNRFAFMPFGLGPHMCVGLHLAMLEGPLAIARLLQRWSVAPIPGREPTAKISTTMSTKDGVWLELSPRSA